MTVLSNNRLNVALQTTWIGTARTAMYESEALPLETQSLSTASSIDGVRRQAVGGAALGGVVRFG